MVKTLNETKETIKSIRGEESIKKTVVETLNETKETIKAIRENRIKLDVTPTFSQLINNITLVFIIAIGVFVGTKMAAFVPSIAGKAAIIGGSVVVTAITKILIEELEKGKFLNNENYQSYNNRSNYYYYNNPPSPTDNYFIVPSINESTILDSSNFLPGVESTESLQRVLESLLLLSQTNLSILILLYINILFIFINFENLKGIKNRPKLLNMLNKSKTVRKIYYFLFYVYYYIVLLFLVMD